jgi:hypothetical protein
MARAYARSGVADERSPLAPLVDALSHIAGSPEEAIALRTIATIALCWIAREPEELYGLSPLFAALLSTHRFAFAEAWRSAEARVRQSPVLADALLVLCARLLLASPPLATPLPMDSFHSAWLTVITSGSRASVVRHLLAVLREPCMLENRVALFEIKRDVCCFVAEHISDLCAEARASTSQPAKPTTPAPKPKKPGELPAPSPAPAPSTEPENECLASLLLAVEMQASTGSIQLRRTALETLGRIAVEVEAARLHVYEFLLSLEPDCNDATASLSKTLTRTLDLIFAWHEHSSARASQESLDAEAAKIKSHLQLIWSPPPTVF